MQAEYHKLSVEIWLCGYFREFSKANPPLQLQAFSGFPGSLVCCRGRCRGVGCGCAVFAKTIPAFLQSLMLAAICDLRFANHPSRLTIHFVSFHANSSKVK